MFVISDRIQINDHPWFLAYTYNVFWTQKSNYVLFFLSMSYAKEYLALHNLNCRLWEKSNISSIITYEQFKQFH